MSRDWTEQIFDDVVSINIDDVITEKDEQVKRLQEQIYEANRIIGELYHLCDDKKKASSVVCDYLVKYGEAVEVK